ncbi:ribonuclease J [Candidatus Parcubacteria bacterium]|nr:ribonuclease J [Candidatus Parcubacteria bacterium]
MNSERTYSSPRPRTYSPDRPRGGFAGKKPMRERTGRAPRQAHNGETKSFTKKAEHKIPPLGENIRIIPLGGVEEIGRNMTLIEYKDDIIVIDMGFQFQEEDTPGIDYILPNTKYLEDRKEKIKAVLVTHGHLDHIGGIPYIMPRIGNPPMYTRNLTALMIRKRQEEFPQLPPLDIRIVEKDDTIQVGSLVVKFFAVTHTIPDSMGVIIRTPYGSIIHPGDPKLDHVDGTPTDAEQQEYGKFENEKVLLMMNDSTNIDNPGFSTPEKLVHKNLEDIIKNIKGRLIIGTFASQMERMIKIIEVAEKYSKKIVVEGRSMKTNIEIATLAGMLKVKKDTIISAQDIESYPPDRIVILSTGAQGEEFAALMRMANKQHKHLKITKRDTVLLSSSIIPGNEKSVQKLKDNLARQGAKIIHYRTSDVYIHSSGHGNRGELEWMFKKINPKFFMPVHGNHYMLKLHAELAESLGMPEERIVVPDNSAIIEIQDQGQKLVRLKEKAPDGLMMVDGFSVGDMQEVVIRDRQMLAQDGMFVIIASINTSTGKLKKSPDIISRGFVYLRESQDLLQQTRYIIKKTIEDSVAGMHPINFDYVKQVVTDNVSKYLFQQTAKRPIVIPVLLGV